MSRQDVFTALVALLRPYGPHLAIKTDTPTELYLEWRPDGGKPEMFAAVKMNAGAIALHLFPVYTHPGLLDNISPSLRARMQGKSCFSFKSMDHLPAEEVAALLQAAFARRGA